jgi:hypothetical protein
MPLAPNVPNPPPADTAATSGARATNAIPAEMTGSSTPYSRVNPVCSMGRAAYPTQPAPVDPAVLLRVGDEHVAHAELSPPTRGTRV